MGIDPNAYPKGLPLEKCQEALTKAPPPQGKGANGGFNVSSRRARLKGSLGL